MAGINKKKGRTAYKNVKKLEKTLKQQLKDYATTINEMNANVWYGGARSGRWYTAANTAYKGDVKFVNKIGNTQKLIKKILDNLDTTTGGTSS